VHGRGCQHGDAHADGDQHVDGHSYVHEHANADEYLHANSDEHLHADSDEHACPADADEDVHPNGDIHICPADANEDVHPNGDIHICPADTDPHVNAGGTRRGRQGAAATGRYSCGVERNVRRRARPSGRNVDSVGWRRGGSWPRRLVRQEALAPLAALDNPLLGFAVMGWHILLRPAPMPRTTGGSGKLAVDRF
jgi:hypothetical protein